MDSIWSPSLRKIYYPERRVSVIFSFDFEIQMIYCRRSRVKVKKTTQFLYTTVLVVVDTTAAPAQYIVGQ